MLLREILDISEVNSGEVGTSEDGIEEVDRVEVCTSEDLIAEVSVGNVGIADVDDEWLYFTFII